MAEALKLQGFEVTLVSDPAQEVLERAFRDFFIKAGADPDARLFVWFAGHGHTIKNGGGDTKATSCRATRLRRGSPTWSSGTRPFRCAASANICARPAPSMCWRCSIPASAARCSTWPAPCRRPPSRARQRCRCAQFISSGDADQEVSDDGTFRKLFIDALQGAEPSADIEQGRLPHRNRARSVPLHQDDEPDRSAADAALRQAQRARLRPRRFRVSGARAEAGARHEGFAGCAPATVERGGPGVGRQGFNRRFPDRSLPRAVRQAEPALR